MEVVKESIANDSELSAVGLDGWVTISGQWTSEEGKIVQTDKDGFDLATGFAGETFSSLDLAVAVEHLDGVGAGVLFNMPTADALQGAHMVRYADWTDAIVWGYFDELGQFIGQGYAKIEPPTDSAHILRVVSGEGSYAVYLDGEQLAVDIPLFSNSGHIGLITSKAEASFGSIRAASNGQPSANFAAPAASNDFFGDIETISGEWVQEGTKLSQINQATYDFSISTGRLCRPLHARNENCLCRMIQICKMRAGVFSSICLKEAAAPVRTWCASRVRTVLFGGITIRMGHLSVRDVNS